jgi:hypothetical protein
MLEANIYSYLQRRILRRVAISHVKADVGLGQTLSKTMIDVGDGTGGEHIQVYEDAGNF